MIPTGLTAAVADRLVELAEDRDRDPDALHEFAELWQRFVHSARTGRPNWWFALALNRRASYTMSPTMFGARLNALRASDTHFKPVTVREALLCGLVGFFEPYDQELWVRPEADTGSGLFASVLSSPPGWWHVPVGYDAGGPQAAHAKATLAQLKPVTPPWVSTSEHPYLLERSQ